MKRITIALGAVLAMLALGMALPLQPVQAHEVGRWGDWGSLYYKMYSLKVCLRIDTGVPTDRDWLNGDDWVGMSVYYHNRDGNWQEWLNDAAKETIHKYNTSSSTPQGYECSDLFKEAWVRDGHEAMYAYVGRSKTDNRSSRSEFAHWDSHPYEVNMVDHWENHHGHDSDG